MRYIGVQTTDRKSNAVYVNPSFYIFIVCLSGLVIIRKSCFCAESAIRVGVITNRGMYYECGWESPRQVSCTPGGLPFPVKCMYCVTKQITQEKWCTLCLQMNTSNCKYLPVTLPCLTIHSTRTFTVRVNNIRNAHTFHVLGNTREC